MRPVGWSLRYASGTVSAASRIRCSRACSSVPRRRSAAPSWRPSSRSRAGSCSIRPAVRTTAGATARVASAFSTTRCSRFGACSTVVPPGCSTSTSTRITATVCRQAFLDEPRVRTVSIHERGRWPHSGGADDTGHGYARNLPVPAGFNDSELVLPDGRGGVAAGHAVRPGGGRRHLRHRRARRRPAVGLGVEQRRAVGRGRARHRSLAAGCGARRRRLQSMDAGALLDRAVGAVEPPASPDGTAGSRRS